MTEQNHESKCTTPGFRPAKKRTLDAQALVTIAVALGLIIGLLCLKGCSSEENCSCPIPEQFTIQGQIQESMWQNSIAWIDDPRLSVHTPAEVIVSQDSLQWAQVDAHKENGRIGVYDYHRRLNGWWFVVTVWTR